MRSIVTLCGLLFFALAALAPSARAQMTEEQKRQLFLQAREDIRPVPAASETPRPKPRATSTPRPAPTPTPRPKPAPTPEDEEPTPTPKKQVKEDAAPAKAARSEPEKEESTPAPTPKKISREEEEPPARPQKGDHDEAAPAPAKSEPPTSEDLKPAAGGQVPQGKTPGGVPLNAPIVIEKSGLEADQGEQPAAKNIGGWFKRWKYLTPSVRRAIDQARVKKGRWKYIIVHNSGTRQGNARIFDLYHRRVRKMPNGLAYHFVIGNGSSSGDGEIEIGDRWRKQINGGHVASDYLNDISIGICLVGDLNRDRATKAQMAALDELIVYLRGRVGKVKGKPAIVLPHKGINPKPTDCPGDKFDYKWLKQKFGS
jgi:hypothetical protein